MIHKLDAIYSANPCSINAPRVTYDQYMMYDLYSCNEKPAQIGPIYKKKSQPNLRVLEIKKIEDYNFNE